MVLPLLLRLEELTLGVDCFACVGFASDLLDTLADERLAVPLFCPEVGLETDLPASPAEDLLPEPEFCTLVGLVSEFPFTVFSDLLGVVVPVFLPAD